MSLSTSVLTAIQKVGAAAFTADEKLKSAARDYAERVSAAITKNPYDLGNDSLISNWKTVARLSQTLEDIEEELKNVYQVASGLIGDEQPSARETAVQAAPKAKAVKKAAKAARAAKPEVAIKPELSPVEVVAKPRRKAAAPKTKTAKSGNGAAKPLAPSSNPAKLLAHLAPSLNTDGFTEISQTQVAKETGIPLGSMTAAIKKLTETGWLVTGPNGGLKLTAAQPAAQSASTLPLAA